MCSLLPDREFTTSFLYYSSNLSAHDNQEIRGTVRQIWDTIKDAQVAWLNVSLLDKLLIKFDRGQHEASNPSVEGLVMEENISHFVKRIEDKEAHAKKIWQTERQEARKKKEMR